MEDFACIDYDKACSENVPKVDAVCFHFKDCRSATVYIVEKKETLDPTSNKFDKPLSQLELTKNYLSHLCQNMECKTILVVRKLTQTPARVEWRQLPYIVEYERIKNKSIQRLDIREKIAKFVYENKE